MLKKKRIVIAEDHKILRQGLRSLLNTSEDLEVVGEAGDGMSAIWTIKEKEPDLVLLDLNMPKMDGIAVIKEIKQQFPHTKILALTMYTKESYILEVFNSGGDGYCLKSAGHEDLMMAIKAVLAGKHYVSPEISRLVLEGYLESRKKVHMKSSFDVLTQREKEVLKLVGEGYQNKEIADYLCISPKTVEKHRANIMQKLDLHTASELTAYAIEKGLVLNE
ncbi:MAG: response regulator transcription factor [Syntrophales bacterium]|jgi:DNA-binding NarL/FixJ family response regulator|nr:response regulator transcription factor [Syntrophales bacterium]MDY0045613.1 response regulator transcription factor [Syntrophales bacterium]